jgi:hypothetical protein
MTDTHTNGFYLRWARRWGTDLFKAGVGQIISVLLAVGLLFWQHRYGIIRPEGMKANIWARAWPYICLFGALSVYHLFRAPKMLDQERQAAIDLLEAHIEELKSELQAKDEQACIGIEVRDCRINARLFKHLGDAMRRGEMDDPTLAFDVFVNVWATSSFSHLRGVKEYSLELVRASGDVVTATWLRDDLAQYHIDSKESILDTFGQVIEEPRRDSLKELHAEPFQFTVPQDGWLHFVFDAIKLSEAQTSKLTVVLKDSLGLIYRGDYDKPRETQGGIWPNKM